MLILITPVLQTGICLAYYLALVWQYNGMLHQIVQVHVSNSLYESPILQDHFSLLLKKGSLTWLFSKIKHLLKAFDAISNAKQISLKQQSVQKDEHLS